MMKNVTFLFSIALLTLLSSSLLAQSTFNYQGILRDANGKIMGNTSIDLRFRLLPDREQPNVFDFEEEHLSIQTNEFGVFSAIIGSEDPMALSEMDFSQKYFFEVSIKTEDQSSYQMLQRSHLSATPYALHAMTAEDVDDADADPTNEIQELAFDASNNTLSISGGNAIQIPMGGSDADADPENEIQQLTKIGNQISLSGGGSVTDEIEDADADPENEIQQLTKAGNQIRLSGGGSVTDETEDADADPENEMQFLDFDFDRNELSISGGNKITLPFGGEFDNDKDPENELQRLSILGNGNLLLSHGGGQVPLNQSPLVPTTNTDGEFAYKLLRPLAIGKDQPDGDVTLDIAGPLRASTYRLFNVRMIPSGSGFKSLRLENNNEVLGIFNASAGSEPANLLIDQVRIGDVKIRNHFSDKDELLIRAKSGSQDVQLMRLGRDISAINTKTLFVSDQINIIHPSRADGQTGLSLFNRGGNGNSWNLYVANGSGQLEFYHKGTIKGRIVPTDGSYIKSSDARLKTDVNTLPAVLEKVKALSPATYLFKDHQNAKNRSFGFMAQDVEKLFPDLVFHIDEGADDYLSMNYEGFSVVAIKAIQEQQLVIENQANKIDKMEKELSEIRSILQEIAINK